MHGGTIVIIQPRADFVCGIRGRIRLSRRQQQVREGRFSEINELALTKP